MSLRKPTRPTQPGRTQESRDEIALKLLSLARAGSPYVHAIWYGGGLSIAIARTALDIDHESISWRDAHRLAYPEQYVKPAVPRKPIARYEGTGKDRKLGS